MILCHKCAGVLAYSENEDIRGLLDCSCISGWVRGFEPFVTREQALESQIKHQEQKAALYARQERPADWIKRCEEKIEKLRSESKKGEKI